LQVRYPSLNKKPKNCNNKSIKSTGNHTFELTLIKSSSHPQMINSNNIYPNQKTTKIAPNKKCLLTSSRLSFYTSRNRSSHSKFWICNWSK